MLEYSLNFQVLMLNPSQIQIFEHVTGKNEACEVFCEDNLVKKDKI